MRLPTPDSTTRRNLLLGLLLVLLLVVPTALGFAVASAGESRPPGPDDDPGRSSTTRSSLPGVDQSELVSDAPLANAPTSAEEALTRQGEEALGIPRITFISDDTGRVRMENGSTVTLAGGYAITVTIDPYPPADFDLDVRLGIERDGTPLSDVTVDTVWDMTLMTHGPFETALTPLGEGQFQTSFDFFMFGPWFIDTTVSLPGGEPLEFRLSIYVWPA